MIAPDHLVDIDLIFAGAAIDQPDHLDIRFKSPARRELEQDREMVIRHNLAERAEAQMHPSAIGLCALAHQRSRRRAILSFGGKTFLVHPLHQEAQMAAVSGFIDIANWAPCSGGAVFPSLQLWCEACNRVCRSRPWPRADCHERFGGMHRTEFRVRRHAVVTFKEVLHHQLPVGRRGVASCMGNARIRHAMIVEDRPHIAKGRVEIDRFIFTHIDEDEAMEHPDMTGNQAIFRLVEIFRHKARGYQPTIQPECPCVIGADETRRIAAFG